MRRAVSLGVIGVLDKIGHLCKRFFGGKDGEVEWFLVLSAENQ